MGLGKGKAAALAAVLAIAVADTAQAVAPCPGGLRTPKPVLTGQGLIESVIVDRRGRLYFTAADALWRMDNPQSPPKILLPDLPKGGGLAFMRDGSLLVGQGNGFAEGLQGNFDPVARVLKVNPDTGEHTVYATGLSMANGLALGPDGALYASDDVGFGVDRIAPGGKKVDHQWGRAFSTNGLAVDRAGRYLYANQTFVPAAIARIDLKTGKSTTYARPGIEDIAAGLDGMTRDLLDNLYVAANGGGQVWRVEAGGRICGLARGLLLPSAVALGRGRTGFAAKNLYAVTFSGGIYEIADARPAAPAARR